MKKLPIGMSTFREIIAGNYVYADKTKYLYNIIRKGKPYFLSRPRRFGKSLLVSTLKEIFLGHRELFKGLWIDGSDYDWTPHPVIHLSLNATDTTSVKKFNNSLIRQLTKTAKFERLNIKNDIPIAFFSSLIIKLFIKYGKKQKVVVLIDEYDAPILDAISDQTLATQIREALNTFYNVFKAKDEYLRFVLLTGVSRFSKNSFSAINHLDDLTLNPDYAAICGFTMEEFDELFKKHLEDVLKRFKAEGTWSTEATAADLKEQILSFYDGYSWDGKTRVLNPWSILKYFNNRYLGYFWIESGSTPFLIETIKEHDFTFRLFKSPLYLYSCFNTVDVGKFKPKPLMFQTGYLTVDRVEGFGGTLKYLLTTPNNEVKLALFMELLASIFPSDSFSFAKLTILEKARDTLTAFQNIDAKEAEIALKGLLTAIAYYKHVSKEAYFETIFYLLIGLLGQSLEAIKTTGEGRIDAVLKMPGTETLVIALRYEKMPRLKGKAAKGKKGKAGADDLPASVEETEPKLTAEQEAELKPKIEALLNKAAEAALMQIQDKKFAAPFTKSYQPIYQAVVVVCDRTYVRVVFRETQLPTSA